MEDLRIEALRQAVMARREDDTPQRIVERAQAFYDFLDGVQRRTSKVVGEG